MPTIARMSTRMRQGTRTHVPAMPGFRNLVQDSDILGGSTYWTFNGNFSIINDGAVSGNSFETTGTGAAIGFFVANAVTPINVIPGQTYTISGYINAAHVTGANLPMWAVFDPTVTTQYAQATQAAGVNGRVSSTFVMPANVNQIIVVANGGNCVITTGQLLNYSNPQFELGSLTAYQSTL